MSFAVQFVHKGVVAVIGKSAALSLDQQLTEMYALGICFLEHSKARPNNLASRPVAPALELLGNELVKMLPKGYAGIFGHGRAPGTNGWYLMVLPHNKRVNSDCQNLRRFIMQPLAAGYARRYVPKAPILENADGRCF